MDMSNINYGIAMLKDNYVLLTWHHEDGSVQEVELDPESPDVKECLQLMRYIIWGTDE